jgi:hypothetical protein
MKIAKFLAVGVLALSTAFGGMSFLASGAQAAPAPKVKLCHVTGSETNPIVVIEVSRNAVPAHLAHGDGSFFGMTDNGGTICLFVAPSP